LEGRFEQKINKLEKEVEAKYMDMRNIPPNLRLAVRNDQLKAPSITSWCLTTSKVISSFEDIQREFLFRT
jgi:hypothetical protein